MEEQLNNTNQLAQLPEAEEGGREITATAIRGETGKVLNMDQYALRHPVKDTQQFFTLGEAVEYFSQNPEAKEAFQEIVRENLKKLKAIVQQDQSVRKAS